MHRIAFALFLCFAASAAEKWTVEFAADLELQLTRGSDGASAPRFSRTASSHPRPRRAPITSASAWSGSSRDSSAADDRIQ